MIAVTTAPAPLVPPSERVQVAQLAAGAALAVPGVSALAEDPRGVNATATPSGRLAGVGAAAMPDGRFEVALHLAATLVPLHPLGERVRADVSRAVAQAGLAERLGPVSVAFEDMVHPLAPDLGQSAVA